jgi:phospholipid-binding lipoprotein MlaA
MELKTTTGMKAPKTFLLFLLLTLFLGGCATVSEVERDPRDPYEGFNRSMHNFNDGLDKAILTPLAKGYQAITPAPVDNGISNFFSNINDVVSAINNLLQFKLTRAVSDVGRILVNTTLGILGFMDVASNMNLPKYGEDFGQTLGAWGVAPGPYIVLPFFGPSSGRDTVGLVVDWYTDPVSYLEPDTHRYWTKALRVVDQRADLLGASKVLDQAALDPYEFTRDAFLQKRKYDVYDGAPPLEEYEQE